MYKNNPLDAPTGVHNIDKTKPEHLKKIDTLCSGRVRFCMPVDNKQCMPFFNIPAHNTNRDKLSMQGRVRLVILGALMSITVVFNKSVSTFFS